MYKQTKQHSQTQKEIYKIYTLEYDQNIINSGDFPNFLESLKNSLEDLGFDKPAPEEDEDQTNLRKQN